MLRSCATAYTHGQRTALDTFGLTKEAIAPALAALAPLAMQGLRAAGTWAAKKAIPALARGAVSLGKNVAAQIPGAAAQTGAMMAAEKMMPSTPGPQPQPMPGMMGAGGHLPGQVV